MPDASVGDPIIAHCERIHVEYNTIDKGGNHLTNRIVQRNGCNCGITFSGRWRRILTENERALKSPIVNRSSQEPRVKSWVMAYRIFRREWRIPAYIAWAKSEALVSLKRLENLLDADDIRRLTDKVTQRTRQLCVVRVKWRRSSVLADLKSQPRDIRKQFIPESGQIRSGRLIFV